VSVFGVGSPPPPPPSFRQHTLPTHATSAYWAAAERVPAVRGPRQGAPTKKPPHSRTGATAFTPRGLTPAGPAAGGATSAMSCACAGEEEGRGGRLSRWVGAASARMWSGGGRAQTHHKTGAPPTHSLSLCALAMHSLELRANGRCEKKREAAPRSHEKKNNRGKKKNSVSQTPRPPLPLPRLKPPRHLVAHRPHDGLPRRYAQQARRQPLPQRAHALLARHLC